MHIIQVFRIKRHGSSRVGRSSRLFGEEGKKAASNATREAIGVETSKEKSWGI